MCQNVTTHLTLDTDQLTVREQTKSAAQVPFQSNPDHPDTSQWQITKVESKKYSWNIWGYTNQISTIHGIFGLFPNTYIPDIFMKQTVIYEILVIFCGVT